MRQATARKTGGKILTRNNPVSSCHPLDEGIMKTKKPRGYWQVWSNFEKEVREIIGKNCGRLPSQRELIKQGNSDFLSAASRIWGGVDEVRKKLKIKTKRKPQRRGPESYKIWDNILPELKKIIAEFGDLPDAKKLIANDNAAIVSAILKHHGGFCRVREKMDLINKRKSSKGARRGKKSLSKWENLEPLLCEIMKKNNGEIPAWEKLRGQGYGSVLSAASRYHGGINQVRKKMKLKRKRREKDESLAKWKNLEKVLRGIVREYGELPSTKKLREIGYDCVVNAIYKKHNGLSAVRKKMNLGEGRKVQRFTKAEISLIIRMRNELSGKGLNDGQISRILAKKIERSLGGIREKIRRLNDEGMLSPNPSKRNAKPTKNDFHIGLAQAADAMEQFGDSK